MAEFYSVEYTKQIQAGTIGDKIYTYGHGLYLYPFTYTQVANGAIADTIVLARLGPKSKIDMQFSRFVFAGWTAGATLSVGWKAYKDLDGVTQALNATGLLSAISMTTDGAWKGGILIAAVSNPVVWYKDFNNASEVVIFATIGTQAPGAADTLSGVLGLDLA